MTLELHIIRKLGQCWYDQAEFVSSGQSYGCADGQRSGWCVYNEAQE